MYCDLLLTKYEGVTERALEIIGQYYKPIILGEKENFETILAWMYSHDVREMCTGFDGRKFETGHGLKLMEHSYINNEFVKRFETLIENDPKRVVWAGDYASPEPNTFNDNGDSINLYALCDDETKVLPTKGKNFRYIINHTKNLFVDKTVVIENDGYKIHPLPLLTNEGNGQGGGDYHGSDENLVGTWARDLISVSNRKPKGFTELVVSFKE